jgi:hypothetical protein
MNFIFMLTRQDQTVSDCLSVIDLIEPLQLGHIGFKDVGVPLETLGELHVRIKDTGATSYLEVVSTTKEEALASARVAAEIGVDCLLGGTWVSETLSLLHGMPTKYFPFVGRPHGHPTRLEGTPELIADQCRHAEQLGCAGVDLLAYRADQAQPIDLIRAARSALHGQLIVAGSVERAEQIADLQQAGADAFTIGSAAFSGQIEPGAGLLTTQLGTVVSRWLDPSPARGIRESS